ncbi:MAG: bacillithiol biosynthesis cysteine-adding enzyme BshC [Saprospirales bacterium]|nr:bacillithiol biosynthesis cysteine-adding enzyme BshC [Saprospirales bacterium]
MHKTLVPYPSVTQLSKTDIAYATQDPALAPFYHLAPLPGSFSTAIASRANVPVDRDLLTRVLKNQYEGLPNTAGVHEQLIALGRPDTFTVTTAHQPSLLLGPLYFIYKAITTINLAATVQKSTGKQIVPVFVLGSEDHDLEELNHIRIFNKTLRWEPGLTGPVGLMPSTTLAPVLEELRPILGESAQAQALWSMLQESYSRFDTFAEATQALLHACFGRFGLLVLNMNHPDLKRRFIPVMRDDLTAHTANKLVNETIGQLHTLGFKGQAAPRTINLFYLLPGQRERIVEADGQYRVLNTGLTFTKTAILEELDLHPERFSPNVVLRPLYQELILPNLAYVGGGGELAYWLERRSLFGHFNIPYPILIRRNSVLWFDKDSIKRSLKFEFPRHRYFEDTEALIRAYIDSHADAEINLQAEIDALRKIYDHLAQKAHSIDPTLENAVRADEVKTVGHLQQWESRLVRAEKQKHEVVLNQLRSLKEKLFPGGGLQERTDNFIPYYLKYGEDFFDALKATLDPFDTGFLVLEDIGE